MVREAASKEKIISKTITENLHQTHYSWRKCLMKSKSELIRTHWYYDAEEIKPTKDVLSPKCQNGWNGIM